MKKMAMCAGLLAALLAGASAPAQEFEPGVPFPPPLPHGEVLPLPPLPPQAQLFGAMPMQLVMLAEQLDLTADQRKKAGVIMDRTTPQLRELAFRMIDSRKALREFAEKGGSEADMQRLAKEQGDIVEGMTLLSLKARADLRALLTEDQRKKLDEMQGERGMRIFHRAMPLPGPADAGFLPTPGRRLEI